MEIDVVRVARKIQVVDAVHFEMLSQMWEVAQWMKAHKVESDLAGCEFFYNIQSEERQLYVKRDWWIVKDEAGFAAFTDANFQKKFTIEP
jgi:hypothetical protein